MKKKLIKYGLAIVIVVAAGYAAFSFISEKPSSISIETTKIGRADISNAVTATGKIEASQTVEVGTQVSGKIDKLYADFNSKVKKGQLVAQIDTETLRSTLNSSKATLDLAQAEFDLQKANMERNKQLIEKNLISQKDFDEVEYAYKSAMANLNSAKAQHSRNRINLQYAYIYSPIDGIVLERNVEEGETVAASFETPTLFTIANDLKQMKIEADVDEADIGQLKNGQRVEFTVDAFPDKTFEGEVTEIHLMPVENANVITYTVVIDAKNPDELLMPGMTANVTFYVTEKKNILVVPNKALEFTPDMNIMQQYKELHPEIEVRMPEQQKGNLGNQKTVWIKKNNTIYPQDVALGETDEINYELLSELEEGTNVIISMISQIPDNGEEEATASKSPFMPTPPGKNRKK